ncbi:MAG: peptidase M28 [Acidobacteria bacterium]|nr:peptidase M28 [Acidobacteriota bacterium]MDP7479041.1 M28 family metallopeptidase [Vicinamibacterales bacterium]MDP7690977.1 M28 family metallopeptidase [Vicinamibacterales bacterium]HJN43718.1 M28 family metallopeptidase [Vicinamibacterales bacterium]
MRRILAACSLIALVGCQGASGTPDRGSDTAPLPAIAAGIGADTLLTAVERLASDEFEGRAPGSDGETLTVAYLTEQFQALGLEPGNPDGTWVQNVPLVGITPIEGDTMTVSLGGDTRRLEPGVDYAAYTKRVVDEVEVDAEFVFVGYGAVAPEYDWNDFKDVDVSGKILLFLVNDPPSEDLFGGQAMTYYGRWTYKHEIAAEHGAAGALVIHETGPAGYPWEVVGSSPYGESFDLVADDRNMGRAAIEGWIQRDAAASLFEMAGLDFETEKAKAATADFQPVELRVVGQTRVRNSLRTIDSQNVVAKLQGIGAPDEVVLYMAHWDHLGKDDSLTGDQIYNGAADNATGTAGLLELARAFTAGEAPRRSVLFLAVTAEEQGLLGSRYYGEQPLYPAAQTVAALNMDVLNQWGRTNDLTIVGMGQSGLDQVANEIAGRLGRVLNPDPESEKGFYYRSDHFSFARVGIPAFYADPGVDYLDKPPGYGLEKREEYTANDYHAVSDEVKPDWDLSGALDDLTFMYHMGARLAATDEWPEWSATSEFRAIREQQRPGR